MPLPDPTIAVLTTFRPLFTAPTWRKMMIFLTGTLLAQGRRYGSAALRHSGNSMAGNWSSFHQMLNQARWSPLTRPRWQNRSSTMPMKRWSLEVTFEESRAHLDIETQFQCSDLAVERSTPLLFGLYSLVVLGWRKRCTAIG